MTIATLRARAIWTVVWLAIGTHAIGVVVALVRLYGVYWVGHYTKVVNSLVIALCLVAFLMGRKRVDGFTLLAAVMIPFAVWTGAFWGNANVFFLSHLASGFLVVACYTAATARRGPSTTSIGMSAGRRRFCCGCSPQ